MYSFKDGKKVKYAILTITDRALDLAYSLKYKLEKDPTVFVVDIYHKNVKANLRKVFDNYDCIIGVMATGIMVRILTGLPINKITDPAILIIDEFGKNVISLLSGHMGGANEYAIKISALLDSTPIITTATDLNGKMGVDTLARKYYLQIDNTTNIRFINRIMLKDKPILVVPRNFGFLNNDPLVKKTFNLKVDPKNFQVRHDQYTINYKPRNIVAGVGARRGIKALKVLNALYNALNWLDLPMERITFLATAEQKKEEKGIIEASKILRKPLKIISAENIKKFHHPQIVTSKLVEREIGLPGVCEPSALLAAGKDSVLIYRKTAFEGVTVALAVSK